MVVRRFRMTALHCLVVCGILLNISACSTLKSTADRQAADRAAIAAFNQRYLQAINAGDIETLSSLTTAGHIMLPPNRPPLAGKSANDSANRRAFELFDIDETWTPLETEIAGDWAYQRGAFTVVATPRAGGETRRTSGHFLRIYKRLPGGEWRMIRDMFNSDQPPASAPRPD